MQELKQNNKVNVLLDDSNVSLIIPNKDNIELLKEITNNKLKKLGYENKGFSLENFKYDDAQIVKVSLNYLENFIKIVKALKLKQDEYGDSIRLYCKSDYPLKIEHDHLSMIIAPRVEVE